MARSQPDDEGNENSELIEETGDAQPAGAADGDGDGYGGDEGDTGNGQVNPDTEHAPEDETNSGSVVAGRDDIPVDPGNSGMVGDNVYGDRVDQTGDGSGTEAPPS